MAGKVKLTEAHFYVQSGQVRGERRSYWIEERINFRRRRCVEDFGTNKRRAEKRCEELNAGRALLASSKGE